MNPASIFAGVLLLINLGLLVASIRRGPPYGSTFDWIATALLALALAGIWVLRDSVELAVVPFGLFMFVLGYYVGARGMLGYPSRERT